MKDIIKEFINSVRRHNRIGAVCVLNYRIANYFYRKHKLLGLPIIYGYHIIFRHFMGFDIHEGATIGKVFFVSHCFGIAINPKVIIGNNCTMAHNTTIGGGKNDKCPRIGNNVTIAPNSSIIGDIDIGDNAIIGIGSVVVKSIPSNVVAAGNPARIIKNLKDEDIFNRSESRI